MTHSPALGLHSVTDSSVRVFAHFEHYCCIVCSPDKIDSCKSARRRLLEFDDVFSRELNPHACEKARNILFPSFSTRLPLVHSLNVFSHILVTARCVRAFSAENVSIAVYETVSVQNF